MSVFFYISNLAKLAFSLNLHCIFLRFSNEPITLLKNLAFPFFMPSIYCLPSGSIPSSYLLLGVKIFPWSTSCLNSMFSLFLISSASFPICWNIPKGLFCLGRRFPEISLNHDTFFIESLLNQNEKLKNFI